MSTKVVLGRTARLSVQNAERLEKRAAALASALTLPSGIEFARFEHAGRIYALSARVLVEVDLLSNRVPDVVVRTDHMQKMTRRKRRSG